jgi:antitoxin ParD1/3/4
VIRTGLRLLEEREAQLARLRAALDQGEASGPAQPFDLDAFLVEMNRP